VPAPLRQPRSSAASSPQPLPRSAFGILSTIARTRRVQRLSSTRVYPPCPVTSLVTSTRFGRAWRIHSLNVGSSVSYAQRDFSLLALVAVGDVGARRSQDQVRHEPPPDSCGKADAQARQGPCIWGAIGPIGVEPACSIARHSDAALEEDIRRQAAREHLFVWVLVAAGVLALGAVGWRIARTANRGGAGDGGIPSQSQGERPSPAAPDHER
jgi:hypothetical protein